MTKEQQYQHLLPQVAALCNDEPDLVARMANVAALLHETFHFWWTGFYIVRDKELVLGPFQGPVACVRIAYGRGVCGSAWKEERTLVVADVEDFPGHIACSSASKSEIVVPIFKECKECEGVQGSAREVAAVLDIDSRHLASFDDTDAYWLGKIVAYI